MIFIFVNSPPYHPIMDPYAQVNYEYALFRNSLNPFVPGGMPLPGDPGPAIGGFSAPVAALVEAPDQMFPPTVFLPKESLMRWGEGITGTILVLLAFIVKGWWLRGGIITLVVVLLYKYLIWNAEIATHIQKETLKLEGKLMPPPLEKRTYVYQNLLV